MSLREELETQLCVCEDGGNGGKRRFMPFQLFRSVLTPEKIEASILDIEGFNMEFFEKNDVIKWVTSHGRRIFGILVLLGGKEHFITKFIGRDFQGTKFDEKLPFSIAELEDIAPEIAEEFYERQWEFVSPVWSKNAMHRELPSDVRLPFTKNERLGQGGFGVVYEITLHPQHQRMALFPENKGQKIVRKEFKSAAPRLYNESGPGSRSNTAGPEDDYDKELKNLRILNELKHPNIIELVTSYTYRGKHNLVFPLMEGDLGTLLRADRAEYPSFQQDKTFLVALCELSSAIEKVHFYTSEKFDINLMGCHYDLKPKNILVQGSTLVLADFGLSRLSRDSDQQQFSGGGSDYCAPECADADRDFERNAIDRSSDVWSFGCIISEILTYIQGGSPAVGEFRARRKVQHVSGKRASIFHHWNKGQNQGFHDYLNHLETKQDHFSRNIVNLIRGMTALDQKARPNAKEVTLALRKITVRAYYFSVWTLYKKLKKQLGDSFEAYAEYMRIQSWGVVLKLLKENGDEIAISESGLRDEMHLVEIYRCLAKIQSELEDTIERCHDSISPLFTSLRSLGDEIYSLLPSELYMSAKAHWEIEMVRSEDLGDLLETAQGAEEVNTRIATLARIKRMSILAANPKPRPSETDGSSMEIESRLVKEGKAFGSHTYTSIQDGHTRNVLVEWIRYNKFETTIFEGLIDRIESLTSLLGSANNPADFRILRCSNYVHKPGDSAFGLIFELPDVSVAVPKSLATVIEETSKFRERPSLGSRFSLALTLARSLSGFHKVGWLHKSISAYNVLLLIPSSAAASTIASNWLEEPYLIGFNHSRQDDALAFTLGPDDNKKAIQYYHPDYIQASGPGSKAPYRLQYDYYSLGLVLLEIGLWGSLSNLGQIGKRGPNSNREMRDYLLQKRVVLLGHTMGVEYQAAVHACLKGFELVQDAGPGSTKNTVLQLKFEEEVLQRLHRCRA
ncbi:hypothetical protein TWF730_009236 [Orbilia blumenaviensis]|uniref:Protein kinase domain-containing protein n=1 Tax=Orbilia blumenaviensis TaxID=1796055 RepID=A0AAV9UYF3_9PEZI